MIVTPVLQVHEWMQDALPGEQIMYAHDALHLVDVPDVKAEATRHYMWVAHKLGKVALFQVRNENGKFDYIAVRTSERAQRFLDALSKSMPVRKRVS